MAQVRLDTPVQAFGVPAALLPEREVLACFASLSPSGLVPSAAVASWWGQAEVVGLTVSAPGGVARGVDGRGGWDVPPELLAAAGPVSDALPLVSGPDGAGWAVWSAQVAVNRAHVGALRGSIEGDVPGWPPLWLVEAVGVWWLLDGVHRLCAAAVAASEAGGEVAVAARVARFACLGSCPCGWRGKPGGFGGHRCRDA